MNSAHADHPESSQNSNSAGCLSVTTCLPAGFNAAQPKPNKLQSLCEVFYITTRLKKLDACFSRMSFHYWATYEMCGHVKVTVFLIVGSLLRLQSSELEQI